MRASEYVAQQRVAEPDYETGEQRICPGRRPVRRQRIRLCQPERMCGGNSLDSTEGLQSLSPV